MLKEEQALELLAPAKNADQGIEAIRHGADAVYIGAPAFGARSAVPVTVGEIKRVVDFAHLFGAKVYVALNTILFPEEVKEATKLAWHLYEAGADALIIQDLALLNEVMPPIALHASTQMDNVSSEKLAFWSSQGIEQAVVARELSPRQIARLHKDVPRLRLEAFVHGALCVSYSGRCYASAAFNGRSANRGSCAQVCRLPYDLTDGDGRVLAHHKHLLSIKDLNRSSVLAELIKAGVRSFKIEGRLKDLSYVKNVTAFYHEKLNDFIKANPQFYRSSKGRVDFGFSPDVHKAFNRGFTTFTHHGRGADDLAAFDTPKSRGEEVGTVTGIEGTRIRVRLSGGKKLNNGDGFTFFHSSTGTLTGFRVNTAVGDRITVLRPVKGLKKGQMLYRNFDASFEAQMTHSTATRTLPLSLSLSYGIGGTLELTGTVSGIKETVGVEADLSLSEKGGTRESAESVLGKLGGTPFTLETFEINPETEPLFVPRSLLSKLRQDLVPKLESALLDFALESRSTRDPKSSSYEGVPFFKDAAVQSDNILNPSARAFVEAHGAEVKEEAFEKSPLTSQPLMTTKHCIRYALGMCPTLLHYDARKLSEPWALRSTSKDTTPVRMRIEFDCPNCQMLLFEDTAPE